MSYLELQNHWYDIVPKASEKCHALGCAGACIGPEQLLIPGRITALSIGGILDPSQPAGVCYRQVSISVEPELGDQIVGREDRKKKISEVLLRFRALGYWAAFALIGVAAWHLWSRSLRSTIVIEAGPKGGFFNDAATLLKNELWRYDIDSVVINRSDTLKIIEDVNDSKSPVRGGVRGPGDR
jgi:hypothetical protein